MIQLRLTLRELFCDKISDDEISYNEISHYEISDEEFSDDDFSGNPKTYWKPLPKQNRRPEPRKHTKDSHFGYLGVFNLDFFRHYATFFRKFFGCIESSLFDNLQQNGC